VTEFPTGVTNRFGDFGGACSSFEFVDCRQNSHVDSLTLSRQVAGILVGIFLTE
jgi:hypothetical protein